MTITITEGTSTSLQFELPPRDGSDGVSDLSGYTTWVVKIGRPRVSVTITHSSGGSTITATAGVITVTPGATARAALAALLEGEYLVEIVAGDGTNTDKWRDTLKIERGVRA